jgi:hypothetical protein
VKTSLLIRFKLVFNLILFFVFTDGLQIDWLGKYGGFGVRRRKACGWRLQLLLVIGLLVTGLLVADLLGKMTRLVTLDCVSRATSFPVQA